MQRNRSSLIKWGMIVAVVLMTLPVTTFAQRRWVVVRPRRQRVVVYQPQPSVIYRRSYITPYNGYNYTQPYYGTSYYPYTYQQPYTGTTYYSNQYAQPYYAYRSAYVGRSYGYREYRPRYRRQRVRFGIYFR